MLAENQHQSILLEGHTLPEELSRNRFDAIVIAGLTGTGKTELSLKLAEYFAAEGQAAEIVNADALQFYKGMDIGTAKLSVTDRARYPHHLFDFLEVTENGSVADFQRRARKTITQIQERGAVPVIVGGSGLYLSAIFSDFDFPPSDPKLRERLENEASTAEGLNSIREQLLQLSPNIGEQIDIQNPRRVIRALEVRLLTGADAIVNRPEAKSVWQQSVLFFLDGDREKLKTRLFDRAQGMFENGLLEEVAALKKLGLQTDTTAGQAIGYAQAMKVLEGEMTREEAVDETARLTQRFARRQRSWFNRHKDKIVLNYEAHNLSEQVYALIQEVTIQGE